MDRTATDVVIFDLVVGDLAAPWFVEACRNTQLSADALPKFVCLVEMPLVAGTAAVDWLRLLSYDDDVVVVMVKPIAHEALLSHLRSLAESDAQPSPLLRYVRRHHELETRMSHLDTRVDNVKQKVALLQEHLCQVEAKM